MPPHDVRDRRCGDSATEAVLGERARRADRRKFDEVMSRAGGTPPREGDELPEH